MPHHYTAKPLPGKTYKHKQSHYNDTPSLSTRCMVIAPSNSGKTVLLVGMITDVYADCFDAGIHVFSHSINIDDAWKPVKRFMEERGFDPAKYCHERYDEEVLAEILSEQKAVVEYQKRKGHTPFVRARHLAIFHHCFCAEISGRHAGGAC